MKSQLSIITVVLFTIALFLPDPVYAQIPDPVQLTSSSVNPDQDFGFSVDVFGDVVVVGAFRDDDGLQLERGAAYVYRFDGSAWNEEAMMTSSTPNAFNWLGWDVAISGDVILISERNGDALITSAGNIDVYRFGAGIWTQEATLTPPSGMAGEDFGFAVDVDGQVAAVGAPTKDGADFDAGAVYVYRNTGAQWDVEATLTASDAGLQNLFGSAISIDGDRMLVSAFNADDSTSFQGGKVYVFDFDGAQWNETAILQSNESNGIANMGISVGLDGDWAVSGAPGDNELGAGSGAAIVHHFDGANWNFHSKLSGSDGQGFFLFGSGIAVEDDQIVLGAENWAPAGQNSTGKAYVFTYDDGLDIWNETGGLVPTNGEGGDEFGQSVSLHGGVIVVGSPNFGDPGAAFVYGDPGTSTSTSEEIPSGTFEVSAPFPNPFSGNASLVVTPATEQAVRAILYDVLGRPIRTLFEGRIPASSPTTIEIKAGDAPIGVYWIRIESEAGSVSRSLTLLR